MESSLSARSNEGNGSSLAVKEIDKVERDLRVPTFATQANALMRKNVTFQMRSWETNFCIVSLPILMFTCLLVIQSAINTVLSGPAFRCGCQDGVCGIQYSNSDQYPFCSLPHPPEWPGVMQVPRPQYRAVVVDGPLASANPATILWTGASVAASALASSLLISTAPSNTTPVVEFSTLIPGSASWLDDSNSYEPAFLNNETLYVLQNQSCNANSVEPPFTSPFFFAPYPAECLSTQLVQRNSVATINSELYRGFRDGGSQGNPQQINEYVNAYDFGNTDAKNLDVSIFWNQTMTNYSSQGPPGIARVSRPMNLAAQAFLRFIQGPQAELPLWFVKEMPKPPTSFTIDFSAIIGPLFYAWVIQLLFPVILTYLVYEKQQNLRIMMKMHGLGDGAYWVISYFYFLALSVIFTFFYVVIGSVINLKFFTLNSYALQFIFYFIYINLQISLGFLAATIFSSVRTATICGYLYVMGFGLLGNFFYENLLEDLNSGRGWIFAMELIPGFSLFRGLYEFSQYSFVGDSEGTKGMNFSSLSDKANGMTTVWVIQIIEWPIFLVLAWYLDQVVSSGSGVKNHPLFLFNQCFKARSNAAAPAKSLSKTDSGKFRIDMEKPDVLREREKVEKLLEKQNESSCAIVCDHLNKVYSGTEGNANKYAVRGLSLAVGKGECFGMLGPNGAGKTTAINMMIGFLTPTSGTAYINGLDIRINMDKIYTSMGVCPQHDLIWENLTGREHLLFYGRLKNLKGAALEDAVNESLKNVNLFHGGVGNKRAGQYSGGMKRRLSVAISLIGNPQVVYMDEPSTGLDPASRYSLWNVVKQTKQDRAIILTTHSMEEADALCDRLGIFVDGQLQCIGDSKELTARYGGVYVLTITTPSGEESDVEYLVKSLSGNAKKVYGLAGTQKFEIPKSDVEIGQVFTAMQEAKKRLAIQAWGIADTTLEDVFVKVARDAQEELTPPEVHPSDT